MNKEISVCIIVIICVVLTNIILENYTSYAVELMDDKLELLEKSLKDTEIEEKNIKDRMDDSMNNWKEIYKKLAYFIEHDELEKVETELTEIKANIEEENYEEVIPSIEKSIFILNHIREKFRLNLKNIF